MPARNSRWEDSFINVSDKQAEKSLFARVIQAFWQISPHLEVLTSGQLKALRMEFDLCIENILESRALGQDSLLAALQGRGVDHCRRPGPRSKSWLPEPEDIDPEDHVFDIIK